MLALWSSDAPTASWLDRRPPAGPSKDHVKPRGLGGYDKWRNYRLAHVICNGARKRMAPEVFRANIGSAAYWAGVNGYKSYEESLRRAAA